MKDFKIPLLPQSKKMVDTTIYSMIGIFDLKNKKTPLFLDKRGISNTMLSYFITYDADEARIPVSI
jgi:hypothetical protein